MSLTPYQAKYFAHELTRRWPSDSVEKFSAALVDATVELNPHQVEAALFAFRSPLSKGAILADEVGLGKTIEAGLVISQRWAERKRRILVITPSNLRKQWHQELSEKFFLPCTILEAKSFNQFRKEGNANPFEQQNIVITSYNFAANRAEVLRMVPWDLVVIDEAHRLRNVYRPSNVTANKLKDALAGTDKILLTATPLQNTLLELYGLVSFIDERAFGDVKSFREQFSALNDEASFHTLKARLKPLCHRTLRRQVISVHFTNRHPLVEEFLNSNDEDRLYDMVSSYLQRERLAALPMSQRALITMVMRKLLASSTFAIAGALEKLIGRLEAILEHRPNPDLEEELDQDFEALDESAEEWPEETEPPAPQLSEEDARFVEAEVNDLKQFRDLALSIKHNAKGKALLKALDKAMDEAARLGGARKAIIFTESRRTQNYLLELLSTTQYGPGLLLFNGDNRDERSKTIYNDWLAKHTGTDRVTGSRTADMRSALVDYFREKGSIMIATEAGAEGINLQFCSLVINYDLPWNPQRIEQRIGRCHRYGQASDVVVLNFVNRANEADQRVFELLSEKFKLFEGVFGASDEVLGALESGVDIERRIAAIYQKCRTREEIKASFEQLQLELQFELDAAMKKTRQQLIENFDEEVRDKLRVSHDKSKAYLNAYERMLMKLTAHELGDAAEFTGEGSFELKRSPFSGDVALGRYELPRRNDHAHLYRLEHPLAKAVVKQACERPTPVAEVVFNLEDHEGMVSVLEPLKGQRGTLALTKLTVESLGSAEDHLLIAGHTAVGEVLPAETLKELFRLSGRVAGESGEASSPLIEVELKVRKETVQRSISQRNAAFYEAEAEKLEGWADDQKLALERDIKEVDKAIKEAKRASVTALSLEEKLEHQRRVRDLEKQRSEKRRALFEAQDGIDRRRDEFIATIESKLTQDVKEQALFIIQWTIH